MFKDSEYYNKKTFEGNWQCDECGKEITELPFEPDGSRPVYCKECMTKKFRDRNAIN